jgi:hypothetical protein
MNSEQEAYIRRRFDAAEVKADPFAHLVVRDVLPTEVYEDMDGAQPAERQWLKAVRRRSGYRPSRRSFRLGLGLFRNSPAQIALSADETDFPEVSAEWREKYEPYLAFVETLLHGKLKRQDWRPSQKIFFYRPAGWAIVPHAHSSAELTNSLLYMPSKHNTSDQGTFFYRIKPGVAVKEGNPRNYLPSEVEAAGFIPYTPNTLVSWVNSPTTVHGSVELSGGAARRYWYMTSVPAE